MPNLNLNKPLDFAKLTLSTASNALLQLTGLLQDEWDIAESAYIPQGGQPILFHVFESPADYNAAVDRVEDSGGRRKVPFKYPYVDGQTTDDLGREAEEFTFNILLHGPGYKAAMDKLIGSSRGASGVAGGAWNDPRPGVLVHPVRGRIRVVPGTWRITHESSARQAVAISVNFMEHNFDVTFEPPKAAKTVKSVIADALGFFQKLQNVITKIDASLAVVQSFKTLVTGSVQAYSDIFAGTLARLNATFNTSGSTDLPGLLPVNDDTDNFPTVVSPSDPFASVPVELLSQSTLTALAVDQAIDEVKALREQANATIALFSEAEEGELIFRDDILEIKRSAIAAQEVLEVGLQTSKARVRQYILPYDMSLREAAWKNGLTPDQAIELEVLNPEILSTNLLMKGSALKVPSV